MPRTLGMIAAALVVLAGGTARGGGDDAPALEGTSWRLTRLPGVDAAALVAAGGGPTVRLEQGRLQAFGGCNRQNGAYTVAGDRLTVGPLAGTMMACAEPVMTVESAFGRALAGSFTFRVDGEQLSLTPTGASAPTLTFVAAPAPRLEGVVWEVTGYNNGRQAVVSPLKNTVLTISFADGAVTGSAGCNQFRATYTADGQRLTIGPAAATRKACAEDVMRQEREFLAALQTATAWAIDTTGMLDVHRADGERVLHARPARP